MQNGKTMLNLKKFRQNFHPVWAKMMANLFRRGISVLHITGFWGGVMSGGWKINLPLVIR